MLICQLTDLHVRPVGKPVNRLVETNLFTERAFRAVSRLSPRPDVVVITGDLTESGLDTEYANVAWLLRKWLPMPVFVIPGNHDQRAPFRQALQHLPGVTTNPHYVQYAVEDYAVRLVMLDTLVAGAAHGELGAEQLEFLDRTLAAAPDKPTIVAMHHPPFVCGIAHMDRINLRTTQEFTAVIARHRQVERIICGHHHRPVVARVAHAIASIAPSVAHQVELSLDPHDPGAFIFEPPAFHLHRWTPTDGIVTHTAYVEDFPGPYPFASDPEHPGGA
jgi:Icc protein